MNACPQYSIWVIRLENRFMKKFLVLFPCCGTFWLSAVACAIASSPPPVANLPETVAQALPPRDRQVPTDPLLQPRPGLQPLPTIPPGSPPPSPLELPSPAPPPGAPIPSREAKIQVKKIVVLGSTVFSEAELAKIVRPYENQYLTFEQLLEIRTVMTRLYTDRGYVTSGAFLPPQDDLASGVIKIQVIEGELERLDIKGLLHVRDRYVRQRLQRAARPPLNLRELEATLQLLQQNPLFSSVRAELRAGTTPGRSVLIVTLKEARAFHAAALVANQNSPSVGSIQGTLILSHDNISGFGDRFGTDLGLSSGVTDFNVGYAFPVNARDGTLFLRYQRTRSQIVEPPFSILDINSNTDTFSVGFRQPIVRTPTTELALGLSFDWRQSQTFLFGNQPFSFSPGPDLGESKVRVLRFTQDWINRNPWRVLAARSQLSFGLPIFGATQNEAGIDGQFFSWVGQFQWVQALSRDVIAIARVTTQLTPDALLPLEQFSIGGLDTVRGYRQNFRVGDNGVVGSLEIRFPILQQADGIGTVQLVPFVDIGKVWNNAFEIPSPQLIASTGLGLNWQVGSAFTARLDWGMPLVPVERQGNTLQDYGVVFSIRLQFL